MLTAEVTDEVRRNYLVSEQKYHATKSFSNFMSNRNKKTRVIMTKPVYLGYQYQNKVKQQHMSFGMIM